MINVQFYNGRKQEKMAKLSNNTFNLLETIKNR